MTARIRVLTVDDHPIYRDGISSFLALHEDLEQVGEAANGIDAIAMHRMHRPDVTLMDLSMPGMGGVAAISAIVDEFPQARIIALTTYAGDTDIFRALEAGARGYLLKDVVRNELLDAVRAVHAGRLILPSVIAQRLASFTPRIDLTRRELDVLEQVAKGMRNKDVASAIGRTEATVKVHMNHIVRKLGVSDRTEAVMVALRRGIIHLA